MVICDYFGRLQQANKELQRKIHESDDNNRKYRAEITAIKQQLEAEKTAHEKTKALKTREENARSRRRMWQSKGVAEVSSRITKPNLLKPAQSDIASNGMIKYRLWIS